MDKFFDMTNDELQILKRALKCYVSELDWSNKETLCEDELLEEVQNELGRRFNAEQV